MKKDTLSIISESIKLILIAVLLVTLCLNISTLWAIGSIKHGEPIQSGYYSAIIGSGSMAPAILVNDLLLLKGEPSYQTDDIITYVSQQGSLITHRVKEVLLDGYITQGDANNICDEEISSQKVLGKVIFVISGAGAIVKGILSPAGVVFSICIFTLLWLLRRIGGDQIQKKQTVASNPRDEEEQNQR